MVRSMTRSPKYPYINIKDALGYIEKFYKKEKMSVAARDVAFLALGYSGKTGPATRTLSALIQFGLLTSSSQGVKLSERAIALVTYSPEKTEYRRALQEAALLPPVFREIYEKFPEASDENIKYYLTAEKQFIDEAADKVIKAYRVSRAIIKGLKSNTEPQNVQVKSDNEPEIDAGNVPVSDQNQCNSQKKNFETIRLPLLSRGLVAEINLIGDTITSKDLEHLAKYIELIKESYTQTNEDS